MTHFFLSFSLALEVDSIRVIVCSRYRNVFVKHFKKTQRISKSGNRDLVGVSGLRDFFTKKYTAQKNTRPKKTGPDNSWSSLGPELMKVRKVLFLVIGSVEMGETCWLGGF